MARFSAWDIHAEAWRLAQAPGMTAGVDLDATTVGAWVICAAVRILRCQAVQRTARSQTRDQQSGGFSAGSADQPTPSSQSRPAQASYGAWPSLALAHSTGCSTGSEQNLRAFRLRAGVRSSTTLSSGAAPDLAQTPPLSSAGITPYVPLLTPVGFGVGPNNAAAVITSARSLRFNFSGAGEHRPEPLWGGILNYGGGCGSSCIIAVIALGFDAAVTDMGRGCGTVYWRSFFGRHPWKLA